MRATEPLHMAVCVEKIAAGIVPVSDAVLRNLQIKRRITSPVVRPGGDNMRSTIDPRAIHDKNSGGRLFF